VKSRFLLVLVFLFAFTASLSFAQARHIPKHGPATVLFDGHDLSAFNTFLPSTGLNSDPAHVFTVERDAVHVSGKETGYFITKQEFKNYYLRLQFKWGEGTYGDRHGMARDAGILFNVVGPDKVWPRSMEFQICEGSTGDFWLVDGAAITPIGPDGKPRARVQGPVNNAINSDRFHKSPFKNVVGWRDPANELERTHGAWNTLEMINRDGHVWLYVNGKLANEGTDATPAGGRILFQSEGAEVFYREIKLYPLK
jgi:hypothetical protein